MGHEIEANQIKERGQTNILDELKKILDSIPQEGNNPETSNLVGELKGALFSPGYVSELQAAGTNIENISSGYSRNKVEIIMQIKFSDKERQVVVRYKRGEPGYIRVTNGVWGGEMTLKEEVLPETVDETKERIRKIVEELTSA